MARFTYKCTSVNDRAISPFHEGLTFTKPYLPRSVAKKTREDFRIYSVPLDLMSSNLHLYLVVIVVVIVVVVVLVVMMVMMTGMCLSELLRHQSQYLRKDHSL